MGRISTNWKQSLTVFFGVGVFISGLLACTGIQAQQGPPAGSPGQSFAEILAQMAILNGKIDTLQQTIDKLKTDEALRGVSQNWDKQLDFIGEADGCNSDRFDCLWGNTVVRDNETGLLWERSPRLSSADDSDNFRWAEAIDHCADRVVGGRKGWQLPMLEQMASLIDTNNDNPALPTIHPFQNVVTHFSYWSATTVVDDPSAAWTLFFGSGNTGKIGKNITHAPGAWCVRGGQHYDGQDVGGG